MTRDDQYQKYFLGGLIKKALPAAASFIPGVGGIASTALNAALNGGGGKGGGAQRQMAQQGGGGAQQLYQTVQNTNTTVSELKQLIQDFHSGKTPDAPTSKGSLGMRQGGLVPMGQDALEVVGPKHEGGGVKLEGTNAEVEGGETMDFIATKNGKVTRQGQPYVFSDVARAPGSNLTFSKMHKQMVKRGADPEEIQRLAHLQEKTTRGGSKGEKKFLGGLIEKGINIYNNNKDTINTAAQMAPSLYNLGRGAFGNVEAPQAAQINHIEGPDRADFAPVDRSALAELNDTPELRLNYDDAYGRNAAQTRTLLANRNLGFAEKLAAASQGRQNINSLRADKTQRESMANFNAKLRNQGQRASLMANMDRFDAGQKSRFASLLQNTRQANANIDAQNSQIGYQNQAGRLQAEEMKSQMFGAGLQGISQLAGAKRDRAARRQGDQTALAAAFAGADPAVMDRLMNIPAIAEMMGVAPKTKVSGKAKKRPSHASTPSYNPFAPDPHQRQDNIAS